MWAFLENFLDGMCVIAFNYADGKTALPRDPLPTAFRRKVEYLRKGFRRLPKLAPWRAEMIATLAPLTSMAVERHRLLHSMPSRWSADGVVSLIKWEYGTADFSSSRSISSAQEINTFTEKVRSILGPAMPACNAICRAFFPDYFQKADSEITG